MRRLAAPLVLAGLALGPLAACARSGGEPDAARPPAAAAHTPGGIPLFEGGDFYAVPDPLPPGDPGQLIRVQRVPADTPGTVYRIMYHSRSLQGRDIAVTGLAVVPPGEAPAEGWPVVSWAHGTTGIADQCAPSKEAGDLAPLAGPLLERGWMVVATDYEGLGTPGRHPYVVGDSEGRGVLDAARAVQGDDRFDASDRVAIWGHSQGGHAALFAAELAAEWAPELDVVGAVAGAPATELPLLTVALRNGPFQGYLAMGAAGFNAANPDALLELLLTEEAIERMEIVDRACTAGVFEVFNGIPFEEMVHTDPGAVEPWASLLHENNPGTVAHDVPLLVVHGTEDDQIPAPASQLLTERMCRLGQVIDRRLYEGAGHGDVVAVALPDVVGWIDDRFAGRPAPSTCEA